MNKLTPVAVFVYNRPRHVKQLFDSLLNCRRRNECNYYIFCDGAKKVEDEIGVRLAREVVNAYAGLLNANVFERDVNLGLARSVVAGVTDLCSRYGRVVVLEDDFILHPAFLDFMIQSLDRYESEERVAQVAGFTFPIQLPIQEGAFFLPLTTSWGWATWERAWKYFSWDIKNDFEKLEEDIDLRRRFDLNDAYPYFDTLCQTLQGKIDSWAIRWYLQTFIQDKLTIYPWQSLVWQNGFDEYGTHTRSFQKKFQKSYKAFMQMKCLENFVFPRMIEKNEIAYELFQRAVKNANSLSWDKRVFNRLKAILSR